MYQYVPEMEKINPVWFTKWGETFGSPELAKSMYNNERLRQRVYSQMLASSDLDLNAQFSDVDAACLHVFTTDREKLKQVCGLVTLGHLIRGRVAKSEYDFISKTFSLDDVKLALSLRELHHEDEEFEVDFARLPEMVKRAGEACVAEWRQNQSEQMQLRLALVDDEKPASDLAQLGISSEHAMKIVSEVGIKLAAQS